MTQRALPLFVLITLGACWLSYKFGSAPAVHAAGAIGEWSVFFNSHSSAPAGATQPGVAGVQYVADCITAGALIMPGSTPTGPISPCRRKMTVNKASANSCGCGKESYPLAEPFLAGSG